jgi:hypothetical protein
VAAVPRYRLLAGASGFLLAGGSLFLAGVGTAGAQPTTQTFSFTDGAQGFTVPANVCQITVDAFGAQGGDGDIDSQVFGVGALGGRAAATTAVTQGETLLVFVGGAGGDAPNIGIGEAGFPDGGDGGSGGTNAGGGGGGGSSSVRRGTTALVLAGAGGGGGGGGQALVQGDGGAGGGTGENGTNVPLGAQGGQSGGNGGAGGAGVGAGGAGASGAALQGGAGGDSPDNNQGGGGGGGGAVGGGGGGASSANNTNGGGGGGGGSGSGPAGTTFDTGVRSGDGEVTITFEPDPVGCPSSAAPTPPAPPLHAVPETVAAVPVAAAPRFTG